MKKPAITTTLVAILLSMISFLGYSQENEIKKALWYGYIVKVPVSSRWYNETEVMERHFIDPFLQSQFLVRTRFHKEISGKSNFGFGGSVFLFYVPQTSYQSSFTLPELRPHGEYNFKANLGPVDLENRLRGELRFFKNTNEPKTELENGFHFGAARFRYRLQAVLPIAKISEKKSLKFKLADELMAMVGGTVDGLSFDQNRISADFSISFSPLLSLDLGYVNWFQSKPSGGYLEQHILRTVLKHQLHASKK
jgi:hypothetical protein